MLTRKVITCLHCKTELGESILVKDTELLQLSGMLCREVRGVCPVCGHPFYWSVSDKNLEKLVQRIKKDDPSML